MNLRILIVDNHPLMRDGFSILLNRVPGFEVAGTAVNGRAALECLADVLPDVVLMDAEMPVMDGVSATKALLASRPDLVVIGLTAHDTSTKVRAFLDAGAKEVFTKGDDTKILIERLQRLCGQTQHSTAHSEG